MSEWHKPEVTDVTIECREDILANCWSLSAQSPMICTCGFIVGCPEI